MVGGLVYRGLGVRRGVVGFILFWEGLGRVIFFLVVFVCIVFTIRSGCFE